jgi:hypothetical protein
MCIKYNSTVTEMSNRRNPSKEIYSPHKWFSGMGCGENRRDSSIYEILCTCGDLSQNSTFLDAHPVIKELYESTTFRGLQHEIIKG